jgi:hypothetical protein
VCTENSIRIDYVTESPNLSGDDRAVLPLPGPVRLAFKSKSRLEPENAALRHQLIVLQQRVRGRFPLTNVDRLFFVQLYRWFPSVLKAIAIILPETVVRWASGPASAGTGAGNPASTSRWTACHVRLERQVLCTADHRCYTARPVLAQEAGCAAASTGGLSGRICTASFFPRARCGRVTRLIP